MPTPDDRGEQDAVHGGDGHLQHRHQPHLAVHRAQELVHRLPRIAFLAARVREELDRRDVGVAVDDAPGHQRARVGLSFGNLAQPRDEVPQQRDIGGEPDEERHRQPQIAHRSQHHGTDEVDDDEDRHVEHLHHHFADRERSLHQLGADAAGELVLEVAHRLAQQIAMRHPADALREVAEQRLVDDQRVGQLQQRQHAEQNHCHQPELPALVGEEGRAVGSAEPVDDRAHEAEQRDLEQRNGGTKHRHGDQPALGALGIVQAEGQQPLWRLCRLIHRIRLEPGLEPLEHASKHWPSPTSRRTAERLQPQQQLRSSGARDSEGMPRVSLSGLRTRHADGGRRCVLAGSACTDPKSAQFGRNLRLTGWLSAA